MSALDDLVKSGKLRYVGISDAPPWKVALAQNDGSLPRLESHDWTTDSVFAAGMGSSRPALHPHFSTGTRRSGKEPGTNDRSRDP
jgi:hypothetical protein